VRVWRQHPSSVIPAQRNPAPTIDSAGTSSRRDDSERIPRNHGTRTPRPSIVLKEGRHASHLRVTPRRPTPHELRKDHRHGSETAPSARKQNCLNAKRSTGPKSIQGKEISRCNSLTHGLTAKVVILPEENPADIKAQADAWHDACQPKNHDEKVLVERLALASRQLERIAKAEDEVIDEQVRYAQVEWDKAQQNKLVDALRVLPIEPVRALVELRSFGAGVSWLLARWDELELAFEAHNGWPHLYQIQKALKFAVMIPT